MIVIYIEFSLKPVNDLYSGVNFINILRTAFALVDPKSVKIQLSHQCLFKLLGSTSVKAVHRTLMKLSPVDPDTQMTLTLRGP